MKTTLQSRLFRAAVIGAAAITLSQSAAWADSGGTPFKDLDIRQRPMVEALAVPPDRPAAAGGELKVSATLDRLDRVYKHGDKLTLTVATTEDAYVWVLDTGTSGKVHQIFPNRYEKDNFVRVGAPVTIPAADSAYEFSVSHPKGAELITVIASSENESPTLNLVDNAAVAGPFLALRGDAASVAKDISVSLRKKHPVWALDQKAIRIE